MKLIPLTQGQFAKVGDSDYDEQNQFKWHAWWSESTKSYYAKRNIQLPDGRRTTVSMSREIMKTPKGMKCDHISHDTLDNQRENLRNCTNSQNMMNRKGVNSNNKTGVLGVSPHRKSFIVWITDPATSESVYLGVYPTIDEAKKVRKEAELKYFGEFANQSL